MHDLAGPKKAAHLPLSDGRAIRYPVSGECDLWRILTMKNDREPTRMEEVYVYPRLYNTNRCPDFRIL